MLASHLFAASGRGFTLLARWEVGYRNFVVREGQRAPADPRLMFLAIDDASVSIDDLDLASLYARVPRGSPDFRALELMSRQWPWSRETYALILDKLFAAGAEVVALDLLFPKPAAEPAGDAAFRAALERHGARVILGSNFVPQTLAAGEGWAHALPTDDLVPQTEPLDPRVAYVNFWPDEVDHVVRRASYRLTAASLHGQPAPPGAEVFTSLAARAVMLAGKGDRVPPGSSVERLLRFTGGAGEIYRPISVYQLFVPRYWQANFGNGEWLKGRIIVLGAYGNWQHDEHPTPFGPMPGPELHLNSINALLQQAFLRETPLWADCLLIAVAGLAAWVISLFTARPALQILRALTATGAGVLLSFGAYNYFDLHTAAIAPLLALNLGCAACFVFEFVGERVERARVRHFLERYVSKNVVHELLDNRDSLLHSLEGAHKRVTVLFSDLRGFTAMTEGADAVQLVRQLNEYFNAMVRIVFSNSGTLDKFIGDGLMAHWGSIVAEQPEIEACRAVRTALRMRMALRRLNDDWAERGWSRFEFGVGINSGEAIVGNLGCEEKMEVSVIGDCVNLASRIEGVTKDFHVDLLIGEEVAKLVREHFVLRSVDCVRVVGRTRAIQIFTVLDERVAGRADPAWLPLYEEGVALHRRGEFAAAVLCLDEADRLLPGDWLIGEYLRRSRRFLAEPPGPDWTGVHVMAHK